MAVVAGFHCDVIRCELAWRGVLRGAVETSGSGESSEYGNAVGLTLILDVYIIQPEKLPSIEDRRQTDRVTTPTLAGLAAAAGSSEPCSTPRHANSHLMTSQWKPASTTINQYSQDAAVDTLVARTFFIIAFINVD